MSSRTFGYIIYDEALLVGTAMSLEPYLQGQTATLFESIDKLFQTLHPFAANGTSICFLHDARALKAPWAAYDLSHNTQTPQCFHMQNAFNTYESDDGQQIFDK